MDISERGCLLDEHLGIREQTELIEQLTLSPYATLSRDSLGRDRKEPECVMRTVFQRDRDRIIHCKAFRRLKHKTQVYLAPGNDHYRTRLVHTLEVAQIARGIARALRLNEDLTEAISLGHDLGHTPFGHAGERVLDIVLPEAFTPEGRIVRIADKIAYMNHDIDDSIRAGILSENDIPGHLREILGTGSSMRINNMILNVYQNSHEGIIAMSEAFSGAFYELHDFLYSNVYKGSKAKTEEGKAEDMIEILFNYLCNHPAKVPGEYRQIMREDGIKRAVADYISGMSDTYAVELYKDIFIPRGWDT